MYKIIITLEYGFNSKEEATEEVMKLIRKIDDFSTDTISRGNAIVEVDSCTGQPMRIYSIIDSNE